MNPDTAEAIKTLFIIVCFIAVLAWNLDLKEQRDYCRDIVKKSGLDNDL